MATMKKGITVPAPQWRWHLRQYSKRQFWKRQRAFDKDFARVEGATERGADNLSVYRQQFKDEP